MSKARAIGWSDDGWPILHPEDISQLGDAVDDSYGTGWEEFAEKVLGGSEPVTPLDNDTWPTE